MEPTETETTLKEDEVATKLTYSELTVEQEVGQLKGRLQQAESQHFQTELDLIDANARGADTKALDDTLVERRKVVEAFQAELKKLGSAADSAPVGPGVV